jgi:hypothetical protein
MKDNERENLVFIKGFGYSKMSSYSKMSNEKQNMPLNGHFEGV